MQKTYSANPDISRGELKADPRLKEDLEYRRKEILPALLNTSLDALGRSVVTERFCTLRLKQLL
jgi:hypothetical protein